MNPSGPHDAPASPFSVSDTVIAGPPAIDAIRTLLSSRKPTCLPSGEKNGVNIPSVPGIAVACSSSRDRIRSGDLGPPKYASRLPSGESARRPAQDGAFAIAPVESTISVLRKTGLDVSGLIQPQMAAPVIRIASGITAYSIALSRWLPALPFTVAAAMRGADERLGGTSAECSV